MFSTIQGHYSKIVTTITKEVWNIGRQTTGTAKTTTTKTKDNENLSALMATTALAALSEAIIIRTIVLQNIARGRNHRHENSS